MGLSKEHGLTLREWWLRSVVPTTWEAEDLSLADHLPSMCKNLNSMRNTINLLHLWIWCSRTTWAHKECLSQFPRVGSSDLLLCLCRSTQIKTYSWDNAQVLLVGNKCDMEDERVVSSERGRQLADHLGEYPAGLQPSSG